MTTTAANSKVGIRAIRSLIRPLLLTLLVACVLTVVVTYQLSLRQLERDIRQIGIGHKAHIEKLLWQFDTESIEHQIRDFVDQNSIRHAVVADHTGRIIEAGDSTADESIPVVVVPLLHMNLNGSVEEIGTLSLHASDSGIWSLVKGRVLGLIFTYLAVTAIISLLILRQFNLSVLTPILGIANELRSPPQNLRDLQINLKRNLADAAGDELTELVEAIHHMRDQILSTREELEQGEMRLAQAARLAGLGYCTFDASMNRILDCDSNYANFHRRTIQDLQSIQVGDELIATMLSDEDMTRAQRSRQRIMKLHKDSQTYRLNYPDGEFRHIRQNFVSRFDDNGLQIAVDAVAQDVTDEILQQEILVQSQKNEAVGKLTGGVAHDFNNILAVILGNVEMMLSKVENTSLQHYGDAALKAVTQGGKLTQQLLSFARKQPLSPIVIDVAKLIRASAVLLQTSVGEKVHLEIVSDGGLWNTRADPVQLDAVILNLVVNARDAMSQGGSLTLEVGNARLDHVYANAHTEVKAGNYVCIAVTDSGTGMSAEVVKKAIEPFYTSKPVGKGTGLGLSMAYGFAKQSGGHLKIYSELAHGTTVKLYLPKVLSAETVPPLEIALEYEEVLRGLHVLLIEDNENLCRIFSEQIESLGCVVHRASDERSALKLAGIISHVDLILSDIVIPGRLDGRELSRQLLAIFPEANIIYMSGFTENSVVHNGCLDDGVVFLQKPFRLIDLARVLAQNA